ncbi:putative Ferredoxin-1 [Tripterygium wilfordii]|uniref:Putative Ferredoxin-1 n=1 Tax=Tripterygium wilfordii TaxID=458696 RepID=A0A7J7CXH2_TRIWF|nr:putative Ferredoxin-1 [Tripterygium wilfordii]
MATLHLTRCPSFTLSLTKQKRPSKLLALQLNPRRFLSTMVRSYKVVIKHEGQTTELEVEPDP